MELTIQEWVQQHFPDAGVALSVDDVGTMALAVSHGMGLARMPCYIGDTDSSLLQGLETQRFQWQ